MPHLDGALVRGFFFFKAVTHFSLTHKSIAKVISCLKLQMQLAPQGPKGGTVGVRLFEFLVS